MTLTELKDLLEKHRGKQLVFEYTSGAFTDPDFHITEIKKCAIEAVNCGGGVEYWNESIIQLWENPHAPKIGKPMTTKKALGIIRKVEKNILCRRILYCDSNMAIRNFTPACNL